MKKLYDLNEKNYILYAANNYENINFSDTSEFYEDLKRIIYIKRIFIKYQKTGIIKERLVLNHLIILYNVFNEQSITRILFLKLDEFYSILKPFLVFLNKMPDTINYINSKDTIFSSDINMDENIINILRKLRYESKNR